MLRVTPGCTGTLRCGGEATATCHLAGRGKTLNGQLVAARFDAPGAVRSTSGKSAAVQLRLTASWALDS